MNQNVDVYVCCSIPWWLQLIGLVDLLLLGFIVCVPLIFWCVTTKQIPPPCQEQVEKEAAEEEDKDGEEDSQENVEGVRRRKGKKNKGDKNANSNTKKDNDGDKEEQSSGSENIGESTRPGSNASYGRQDSRSFWRESF